jgi:AcrR family transcriptional regulator
MELMAVQGVEHTSVAQIVREARSSVGSFYARFDGKDDFVQHLEGRVWEDARERWDLALERLDVRDLSTPELVAGVVRLLLETSDADLNRRRVLGAASGSTTRASAFHDHVLTTVSMVLLDRRGEFAHPDPEQAVALGYRVIAGALRELPALVGPNGIGTESLVPELTRLYLGYLRAARPSPWQSRPSRHREQWRPHPSTKRHVRTKRPARRRPPVRKDLRVRMKPPIPKGCPFLQDFPPSPPRRCPPKTDLRGWKNRLPRDPSVTKRPRWQRQQRPRRTRKSRKRRARNPSGSTSSTFGDRAKPPYPAA